MDELTQEERADLAVAFVDQMVDLCRKYGCGEDDDLLPWLERRLKFAQIVGADDDDDAEVKE